MVHARSSLARSSAALVAWWMVLPVAMMVQSCPSLMRGVCLKSNVLVCLPSCKRMYVGPLLRMPAVTASAKLPLGLIMVSLNGLVMAMS